MPGGCSEIAGSQGGIVRKILIAAKRRKKRKKKEKVKRGLGVE
jgi:hypothetical protein